MKFTSAFVAFVVCGAVALVAAQRVAAAPHCTPEVEAHGSEIYGQVFDAKPIRMKPPHIKALLPKQTMGAKLYVRAEKGMTSDYLQRAAVCHSVSRTTSSYANDPLRVDGEIKSIRVYGSGGAFVVSVTADDRATGRRIWERAKALITEVDSEFAQVMNAEVRQDL